MSPADQRPARRARWDLLITVAAAALILDQLTKWWALENLQDQVIDVVWTLRFRLTLNYGSAFSIIQSGGAVISVLALVVVTVLLRTGRRATHPGSALALGLVLGGALGNLADRAFRAGDGFLGGGVVDFVDLQWWPVFNVADMAVVCGAVLLLMASWHEEGAEEEDTSDANPANQGTADEDTANETEAV